MSTDLQAYFAPYRENIIGINSSFVSPYGLQQISYADWTASGRCYLPIEQKLMHEIMPMVGNTHSECTQTGGSMTIAYHRALQKIKQHVNAKQNDVILCQGSGMTNLVNKFQRILGLKIHEKYQKAIQIPESERPIVFVTHMEHHSNQTSWLETIADVEIINPTTTGEVDLEHLKHLLETYAHRKTKIAAVTSCSNVTGLLTPYHQIAEIMHLHQGLCFVDFACSAPYIDIDMHPKNENQKLDAIYFSPHKFLGGPGTSGVLIFNANLYKNDIPDSVGGGTVNYTNPWNGIDYIENIEVREDGGTPGFLQTIKTALCIQLKEEMGVNNILNREHELLNIVFDRMDKINNIKILANEHRLNKRLGVISFFIENCHFNLAVQLLNDRFGVQTRGGCSCAGTYGHYLLEIEQERSMEILQTVKQGNVMEKPGWIRMSIHPTFTNADMHYILDSIEQVANNFEQWSADYSYNTNTNEWKHRSFNQNWEMASSWIKLQ